MLCVKEGVLGIIVLSLIYKIFEEKDFSKKRLWKYSLYL